MKKIVIIGAGSWNFTRAISRDLLTFPALSDSHIVLVDIPAGEEYMLAAEKIIQKTIDQGHYPAKVEIRVRPPLRPRRSRRRPHHHPQRHDNRRVGSRPHDPEEIRR